MRVKRNSYKTDKLVVSKALIIDYLSIINLATFCKKSRTFND